MATAFFRRGDQTASDAARPGWLAWWLLIVAAMVVLIVAVGGITRLTESGLSITEWNVASGILPPLNDAQWHAEFAKYRATPEYRLEAGPAGMTLADFKNIFFWEWFHRLLGRVIGLAFALPLAFAWLSGWIPKGYKPRLLALLALGGLQGVFGWLMVRSGLGGDMTDVSHFWLSIHLCTALFTLAGLVWTALDLHALDRSGDTRPALLRPLAAIAAAVLFVQILLGAWVAGLNAGLASDTWPLMQERFLPEANWAQGAFYALTHDPFLLHFIHRWFAWAAFAVLLWLGWRALPRDGNAGKALICFAIAQVLLGIVTVVTGVSLWIAVAHQVTGALLVAATAASAHAIGRRPAGSEA
ncbi:COX15/CtaA family protein [Alteriqipengyuania lutimaris]|uniref:Heme A synthase n=1 Tax=Alteriqipengyuania lutimaris TaxID=1538146 RepID=A0A395LIL8_9SPHN|nr:COX15/CtaA family protein [Alteriqipengyuania lutimaris]MBB3034300.1 cytochrome c oxidase assembly protein subunit 15 [Alteriqipengyuania lutimaris]RDS76793.1 heme A synthase [Alteriqipengyuania lutimaris]